MIIGLPIGMVNSNSYLIFDETGDGDGAIIDPGGKIQPLLDQITRHRILPRYLLNTHGHFDHTAANAQLKALYAIPLGVHPADYALLAAGGGAVAFGIPPVNSPCPDLELNDGDILEIGQLHLQVYHTPGHTPGSVCIYCPEERALFTGDTLFAGSVGRTDLPGGNARQLTASLLRLLALPPETRILPGHGPQSTLTNEQRLNPWLQRLSAQHH
ncbi:MAG: MBL fold metallo-hydrolase [Anaerolineae bacterium]|nr:MBL fold metallo-hydrolase [Anaerolineae bacterium]